MALLWLRRGLRRSIKVVLDSCVPEKEPEGLHLLYYLKGRPNTFNFLFKFFFINFNFEFSKRKIRWLNNVKIKYFHI